MRTETSGIRQAAKMIITDHGDDAIAYVEQCLAQAPHLLAKAEWNAILIVVRQILHGPVNECQPAPASHDPYIRRAGEIFVELYGDEAIEQASQRISAAPNPVQAGVWRDVLDVIREMLPPRSDPPD